MNAPTPGETLYRPRLMTLLHTALNLGETRFTRRLALSWLASYPGDLPVSLLNTRALFVEGHLQQVIDILEKVCQVDIEYLEAYELLARAYKFTGIEVNTDLSGILYVLGGIVPTGVIPAWAAHLRSARQANRMGSIDRAHHLIHHALLANPDNPLIAATHLQIMTSHVPQSPANEGKEKTVGVSMASLPATLAIRDLAETYYQRWPLCSQFKLQLAQALIACNEDDAAVSIIHQVAVHDITGQVATRLWGNQHIYRTLWPENLSITHEQPIPASVAASLGWNKLPEGKNINHQKSTGQSDTRNINEKRERISFSPHKQVNLSSHPTSRAIPHTPETLRSIQDELNKLAARVRQPQLAHNDGRFPVYVIFTTQRGLELQYGTAGATAIQEEMKNLLKATEIFCPVEP